MNSSKKLDYLYNSLISEINRIEKLPTLYDMCDLDIALRTNYDAAIEKMKILEINFEACCKIPEYLPNFDSQAFDDLCRQVYNFFDRSGYPLNGTRSFICPGGEYYEGTWQSHQKHGKGKLTSKFGISYEGDFKNDMKHGYGILSSTNGYTYKGEFKNDKIEGKGELILANGEEYCGYFKENTYHGYGKWKNANNDRYEGGWHYGKRNGKGKMWLGSGEFYDGE
mmetsp:Transcript_7249/g.7102  ORF Transcript_7249/g.7102 Transcript_7249/m.7102 type:complete len:224 (-) Transcript_7249:1733-2404(-)